MLFAISRNNMGITKNLWALTLQLILYMALKYKKKNAEVNCFHNVLALSTVKGTGVDMKNEITLTKNDSLRLKGLAVILMIFHHCFLERARYEGYVVVFSPFSEEFVVSLSYYFKICVPIFAFISGYGLYLSAKNHIQNRKEVTQWVVSRLIKTMGGFWFVYILAFILTWVYADMPQRIYGVNGNVCGMVYALLDFMGLASLFKTPTMNATWWYMGAAILFVVLVPVLLKFCEKLGYICTIILIIFIPRLLDVGYLGSVNPYGFILAFLFGMMFAEFGLFKKMMTQRWMKNRYLDKICQFWGWSWILVVSVVICDKVERYQIWEFHYAVAPVIVICFCKKYIINVPVIQRILFVLGKYSMDIFLTHTFIRYTFFADFTYSFKYFWLIALVLLIISLGISVLLDIIKKWIQYDKWILWIIKKQQIVLIDIS